MDSATFHETEDSLEAAKGDQAYVQDPSGAVSTPDTQQQAEEPPSTPIPRTGSTASTHHDAGVAATPISSQPQISNPGYPFPQSISAAASRSIPFSSNFEASLYQKSGNPPAPVPEQLRPPSNVTSVGPAAITDEELVRAMCERLNRPFSQELLDDFTAHKETPVLNLIRVPDPVTPTAKEKLKYRSQTPFVTASPIKDDEEVARNFSQNAILEDQDIELTTPRPLDDKTPSDMPLRLEHQYSGSRYEQVVKGHGLTQAQIDAKNAIKAAPAPEGELTCTYHNSDIFGLFEGPGGWQNNGPQCWATAPDLVTQFAIFGPRYHSKLSDFLLIMLTTMPVQRRIKLSQQGRAYADATTLEWNRVGNVEAVNAYLRGTMLSRKNWCSGCRDGKGLFEGCVVIQGRMTGACANHWINSKQAKCDLASTKEQATKKRARPTLNDDEDVEADIQEVLVINSGSDNGSRRVTPQAKKQRTTTQPKKDVAVEIPSHGRRKLRSDLTEAAAVAAAAAAAAPTTTTKSSTQKPAASKPQPSKKSATPRKKAQLKTTSSTSAKSSTASTVTQLATRGGIPLHRVKEIEDKLAGDDDEVLEKKKAIAKITLAIIEEEQGSRAANDNTSDADYDDILNDDD